MQSRGLERAEEWEMQILHHGRKEALPEEGGLGGLGCQ